MKAVLLLFFLGLSIQLTAQQYLYIKQGNEFPEKRYGVSDGVRFRTEEKGPWVNGIIREIGKDYLQVNNVVYPLDAIVAFRSNGELLTIGGTALWAGGILFTGIALVNGVINGDQPIIRGSQLVWGGGLVAAGFGMMALGQKTYHKKNGWEWVTIDLNQQTK